MELTNLAVNQSKHYTTTCVTINLTGLSRDAREHRSLFKECTHINMSPHELFCCKKTANNSHLRDDG